MVQNVLTASEFDSQILDGYAGRQLIHVPVTKTLSNLTGQETLTEGTGVSIKCYFTRTAQAWEYTKIGFMEKGDAVALTKISDGVTKDDLICSDGTNLEISAIDGDATTITITCATHGLSVGDEILILGTTNYDGLYIVATTPTTTTLTISDTSHDVAAETSGQINKDFTKFRIKEAFDVFGVYDSTGGASEKVYTACNLFLNEQE